MHKISSFYLLLQNNTQKFLKTTHETTILSYFHEKICFNRHSKLQNFLFLHKNFFKRYIIS